MIENNYTDKEMLDGCKANNRFMQEQLFKKYYGTMLGICMRYAKDRQEAEEMLLARFGKERMQQWTHLFPKYIICRETDS